MWNMASIYLQRNKNISGICEIITLIHLCPSSRYYTSFKAKICYKGTHFGGEIRLGPVVQNLTKLLANETLKFPS